MNRGTDLLGATRTGPKNFTQAKNTPHGVGGSHRFPDPVAGPRAPKPHLHSQHSGLPALALGGRPRELWLLLNQGPSEPCYATENYVYILYHFTDITYILKFKKITWPLPPLVGPIGARVSTIECVPGNFCAFRNINAPYVRVPCAISTKFYWFVGIFMISLGDSLKGYRNSVGMQRCERAFTPPYTE